jgi:hypothetical protein
MKHKVALLACLGVAAFVVICFGTEPRAETTPWVPFVARQTVKLVQRTAAGEPKIIHEKTGVYMRDSRGSIFIRALSVEGGSPSEIGWAVLTDAANGTHYRIDYQQGQATGVKSPPPGSFLLRQPMTDGQFRLSNPAERFLARKTVGSVPCEEFSVPSASPNGPGSALCFAPSLNYQVIQAIVPEPEANAEIVMTLHDIEVGREPDPKLMMVPEGFTVIWDQD